MLGLKRRKESFINNNAEQVKIIRSNLEKQMDNNTQILMITSPRGASPHVYITSHLAVSFAEQGKNVLLVDADIRNPRLHKYFSIPNTEGFVDVLLEGEHIYSHPPSNFMNGLFILTAGNQANIKTDLWIHKKIQDAIKTWKESFDLVLFHAPSYLEFSDAQVLVDQCDGVLLVVQSGRTKMKDAAAVKQQIDRSKKPILGVIYQNG